MAIKMLRSEEFAPDELRRFLREGKTTAALNHPGIVSIPDIASIDRAHYIVMEYIDGLTLDRWIDGRGREKQIEELQRSSAVQSMMARGPVGGKRADPNTVRAVTIIRTCVQALSFAHERGIIHRDIKPQNIRVKGRIAGIVANTKKDYDLAGRKRY